MGSKITDKERLDWLENESSIKTAYSSFDGSLYHKVSIGFILESKKEKTLRAAIDAAIRAERKSGGSRHGR